MYSCIVFFLLCISTTHLLHVRVVRTPIVHWCPFPKAHHIVLYETLDNGPVCAVDFTPLEQSSPCTQAKLLLGRNVLAEVRTRITEDIDIVNDSDEIALAKILSGQCISTPANWTTMNLYTRNCQHFSNMFVAMLLHNISYQLVQEKR